MHIFCLQKNRALLQVIILHLNVWLFQVKYNFALNSLCFLLYNISKATQLIIFLQTCFLLTSDRQGTQVSKKQVPGWGLGKALLPQHVWALW